MENNEPHWASTILYSLVWLICSLLVIVDVLVIREASLDIMTVALAQKQTGSERMALGLSIDAIDRGMMFFGGILAVSLAIAIEYYFRIGQKKGLLLKRIGRVFGALIGVFIVCVIIQTLV